MRWKKLVKIGFLIFGVIVVFGFRLDFWRIKQISCQINGTSCSGEIWTDIMGLSLGKNIFSFPTESISLQIKNNYPQISKIKIQKSFPSRVDFKLTSRQPQVAISGEKFHLVDFEGVVIEKSETPGEYPLIFLEPEVNLKVGEKFNQKEVLKTIKAIGGLKLRLIEPKMAKIISSSWVDVWLKDDTQLIISLKKEIDSQLDSLQLIYQRAKIEGKKLKQIDVRFDKPIITNG
jgi:cell division septal protein FtsQ